MKKILIFSGILAALIGLAIFNKLISKSSTVSVFAEAHKGVFEISVTNSGELLAENSVEIMGPELGVASNQGPGTPTGGGGGSRGGVPQVQVQARGVDMRMMDFKILDIVPEGTMVKRGDYIAQLDRTSYDNTLKDETESLKTLRANLEMRVLDTAVTLTNLRDEIKNQRYRVEEAAITLQQSKFEPPATIRQAEINLNKAERALEQLHKGYDLRVAQAKRQIDWQKIQVNRKERLVEDLQDFLSQFTIRAPSDGMVTYKKDRTGAKRKAGSSINAFDKVVATLPDLSSMISKMFVSEIDINKVRVGQKVEISIDAFPDKAFTGTVVSVANIGEQLPNSDAKMFEVIVTMNSLDPDLRPAMTTWNKIIIKTIADAVYIPLECVRTGTDSIPYVYKKNNTRQIVRLGDFNDKFIVVEEGIEPGTSLYIVKPENADKFRLVGANLIPSIRSAE
jgi:multidrug efflux pump subunit AcrA (membrane-fusion protein)